MNKNGKKVAGELYRRLVIVPPKTTHLGTSPQINVVQLVFIHGKTKDSIVAKQWVFKGPSQAEKFYEALNIGEDK